MSALYGSLPGLPSPLEVVPDVEDETVDEDAHSDLSDWMCKNDRGPSALLRIYIKCWDNGLSGPSDVSAARDVVKDVLVTLHSHLDRDKELPEHKTVYGSDIAMSEASSTTAEDTLCGTKPRVQKPELTKNIVKSLATTVDWAQNSLTASQEHVEIPDNRVTELYNQLLGKDTEVFSERERLSNGKREMA